VNAPILIVGGGIAGLATALAAAPAPVRLLPRAREGSDVASTLAQGGIAAPVGDGDTAQAHAHDTCVAGSAVFGAPDADGGYRGVMAALRRAAEQHL